MQTVGFREFRECSSSIDLNFPTSPLKIYKSKPFPSKIPKFSNFLNISVPPKNTSTQIEANSCWWKKSCTSWYGKYLIIYRVSYMSGGDRRISSINSMVGYTHKVQEWFNDLQDVHLAYPMSTTSHGGTSDHSASSICEETRSRRAPRKLWESGVGKLSLPGTDSTRCHRP